MDTEQIQMAPFDLNPETGVSFPPNPTQKRILDWVDKVRAKGKTLDTIPVLYIQGGVGCGKTRGIMAPIIEMLLEVPSVRVFWGRQDLKDLKLSIIDKFLEIFPQELICARDKQYNWYEIAQPKGGKSRIYFNGLKDLSGLSSQEFGVIAVSEAYETTEQSYRTLKRRCRQAGVNNIILLESEPPNEDHWLSRLTDKTKEEYDPDIEKWEISTFENWDNLPLAYRGSLLKMPNAWKKKYLYGKTGFIPDGKPFYDGFKEQIHVGDFQYAEGRPILRGWDFGFHHPAVVISQIDLNDRWIILKEIMGNDTTIQKFADRVNTECNINYPNASYEDYGDPACKAVNDQSEKTSWMLLHELGITVKTRVSDYRLRKEVIDAKLSKMITGKPCLMVDRSCKILIDGFLGGYHYRILKPGQEVLDKYEIPFHDDYYSHLMNSMEYIAVNAFKPLVNVRKRATVPMRRSAYEKLGRENAGFGFARK